MSRFELSHSGRVLAIFDSAEELGEVVGQLSSREGWEWVRVDEVL